MELAISLVVFASQVLIWMLTGFGYFWPVWTLFGLGLAVGAHALYLRSRVGTTSAPCASAS